MNYDNWDKGHDFGQKSKQKEITSSYVVYDNWDKNHEYGTTITKTEGRNLTMSQVMNSGGDFDADPDTVLKEGFISPSTAQSLISQILNYAGESGVLATATTKIDSNKGLLDKSNSYLLSKGEEASKKQLNMQDIRDSITEVDGVIAKINSTQIASDISNFNDNLLIGKKKAKLKKYKEAADTFNETKAEWDSETITVRSESSKPHKLLDLGVWGTEGKNLEECYRYELEHISCTSKTVTEDEWHGNNAVTKTKTYYDHTWTKHRYKHVESYYTSITTGAGSTTDPALKDYEDKFTKVGCEIPCRDAIMNIPS